MIAALLVAILVAILFPGLLRVIVAAAALALLYVGASILDTPVQHSTAGPPAVQVAAAADTPDSDAALGTGPLADYLRCLRAAHAHGEPLDRACAVFRGAYVQACETMGTLASGECAHLADEAARRVAHPSPGGRSPGDR